MTELLSCLSFCRKPDWLVSCVEVMLTGLLVMRSMSDAVNLQGAEYSVELMVHVHLGLQEEQAFDSIFCKWAGK